MGESMRGEGIPYEEAGEPQDPNGVEVEAAVEEPAVDRDRELADLQDRHLRLAAEFENYRKRTREELRASGIRAQAQLVTALLETLDDFQRVVGLDAAQATVESVLEGIQLVERKLDRALTELGLEWLTPEAESFDPSSMEAVLRVPAEVPEDDDRVHQVFQRGARFQGVLVRPARVAVRKLEG
jgi:molecular chaperone GrpE